MGERSSIQWTQHTFNPWSGCAKVHAGCSRCYAEALPPSMRRGAAWGEVWQGGGRVVAPDGYWANPIAWARSAARSGERHRVFCASTADVLEVPNHPPGKKSATVEIARLGLDAARALLWDRIRVTSRFCACGHSLLWEIDHRDHRPTPHGGLDWLLLTKRPENWSLVPEDVRRLVWLGTSVSDQETADEWVPRLLSAEGFGVRFLSVEPLLGPVDLGLMGTVPNDISQPYRPVASMIDWVIVGGESGRKARPCEVEWVRDVVRQCRRAGVPVFVKQLGANYADAENGVGGVLARPPPEYGPLTRRLADKKGGEPSEWPEDLRVRELPEVFHG